MAKEAIGIRSYNTYINTLNDLVSFGFIILIEKSKNQYSSNIVALSNFDKALDKALNKALDKALIKHTTKQCESTGESISSIIKQETNNKEQKKPNDAKNDFRKRAREFYDKELLTTEDSRYKVFVEYLFGANSGKIEFKRVLRIEHQLNYQQFCYLLDKCKKANIKLMDIIEQLENYEKRKYTVLFSVLKNWIARDAKMKGIKL
jgi:hypothetical protein